MDTQPTCQKCNVRPAVLHHHLKPIIGRWEEVLHYCAACAPAYFPTTEQQVSSSCPKCGSSDWINSSDTDGRSVCACKRDGTPKEHSWIVVKVEIFPNGSAGTHSDFPCPGTPAYIEWEDVITDYECSDCRAVKQDKKAENYTNG